MSRERLEPYCEGDCPECGLHTPNTLVSESEGVSGREWPQTHEQWQKVFDAGRKAEREAMESEGVVWIHSCCKGLHDHNCHRSEGVVVEIGLLNGDAEWYHINAEIEPGTYVLTRIDKGEG